MDVEKLERDMAATFQTHRRNMQNFNDRLDKLQTLIETMVAKQCLAAEEFIAGIHKPVENEDHGPKDDRDYMRQQIEALEKSEMDQAGMIDDLRAQVKRQNFP